MILWHSERLQPLPPVPLAGSPLSSTYNLQKNTACLILDTLRAITLRTLEYCLHILVSLGLVFLNQFLSPSAALLY